MTIKPKYSRISECSQIAGLSYLNIWVVEYLCNGFESPFFYWQNLKIWQDLQSRKSRKKNKNKMKKYSLKKSSAEKNPKTIISKSINVVKIESGKHSCNTCN